MTLIDGTGRSWLVLVLLLGTLSTVFILIRLESIWPVPVVIDICTETFMQTHYMTIGSNNGRLGNQLFPLLGLIGTARKYCYTPVLEKRKAVLLHESFDLSFIADPPKTDCHWHILNEVTCCTYQTQIDSLNTTFNWTLAGFMQSWRYTQQHDDYIRSVLKFRQSIKRDAWDFINLQRRKSNLSNSDVVVGIHIRRGDFVNSTLGYTTSDVSYIDKAMIYYRNKMEKKKVIYIVVGNDLTWSKANVKGGNIYYSEGKSAAVDLAILSLCNHTIITAGSFGYLGAWLNGGTVVYDRRYPKQNTWLSKRFNLTDYYPKTWIAM